MDPVNCRVEVRVCAAQVHLLLVVGDGGFAAAVRVQAVVVVYPLLRAGKLRQAGWRDHAGFCLEGDLGLGLRSAFSGDENDTVSAAHTVQGGCGCVLEDGEGGDVLCVHKVHVSFHAVHQDQRLAVCTEGVHASDPEVGAGTRLTGVLHDHYTCKFTCKCGRQLAHRDFQLLHVHGCDGANHGCLSLGTVGHHHHFLQLVFLGDKFDDDVLLVTHRDLLVGITKEADDEDVGFFDAYAEASGSVGHRAPCFTFYGDECAGHGLVRLVYDGALDLAALADGYGREQDPQQQGCG